jgi:chromate transporter
VFWTFRKLGSVVFGSGYVLLAFLRDDLVEGLQVISDQQLVDAVASGQITPRPGLHHGDLPRLPDRRDLWRRRGHHGMFAPSFVFVPLIDGCLVPSAAGPGSGPGWMASTWSPLP